MTTTSSNKDGRRRLGQSDLYISRIGFGAWAAGGGGWAFALGPQDDSESIAAIHKALDLGINWIDTAPLYGLGHSEEIVARSLNGIAERPYVFTKCGMPCDDSGRIIHCLRRESIIRECEESLRRLCVDAIDLYQIHWNKPAEELDEALETLSDLQFAGKVRNAGVSNFTRRELERAEDILDVASNQPPYSLIDRTAESDVLPYCAENGIGVIVYSPMASGLLSGAMTRERINGLPSDDLRRTKPEFCEPALTRNLGIADVLADFGASRGVSAGAMAVAWTLQNPDVDAAIVGARRPEQIEGIAPAAGVTLTAEELDFLESITASKTETPTNTATF
ncbi:MAG: aldo/keto reductase [Pyrinomonadaceae bacterium]|nr:aldo/keto reductase [Pyrinomonadaceae bacterium]